MKAATIGIIGGAGPAAGVLLAEKVIRYCQRNYGCVNDYDYPKIILLSYPFSEMLRPDMQEGDRAVERELKEGLDFLAGNGADTIGIACNTLHGFLRESRESRVIGLVDSAKEYCEQKKFSKALVLCSLTSVKKRLYDLPDMVLPDPSEQKFIDSMIAKILSGFFSCEERKLLKNFINKKRDGDPAIEAVVLGCSELSLLFDRFPFTFSEIVDPIAILAKNLSDFVFLKQRKKHDLL